MTWYDVKREALIKMNTVENGDVDMTTEENANKIAAMPQAVNEALTYITGTFRPYRKKASAAVDTSEGAKGYAILDIAADYKDCEGCNAYLVDSSGIPQDVPILVTAEEYLIVPSGYTGTLILYYNAYPEQITRTTADTYEFPYDSDVTSLLPLYVASEVYKPDDDEAMTNVWRSEFEAAVQNLRARRTGNSATGWYSESGWC